MAIVIVFPGFCLNKLQQLFSGSSQSMKKRITEELPEMTAQPPNNRRKAGRTPVYFGHPSHIPHLSQRELI